MIRFRLMVTLAVSVALILGGIWFAVVTWQSGNTLGALWSAVVAVIVVSMAVYAAWRYSTSIRRGLPAEDERSTKIQMYAAGYSYYVSLYLWLALSYAVDSGRLIARFAFEMGILGMAAIWAISWFLLNRKGSI